MRDNIVINTLLIAKIEKKIDFQLNKSKFCSNTIFSICRIILKLEKKHHKLLHLYQWMFDNEIEREW